MDYTAIKEAKQRVKNENRDIANSENEINKWLLENGFVKYKGNEDYDCMLRIHAIHYLFWSSNLKHFFIGVYNDSGKKGPAGSFNTWNSVIIPKPMYKIEEVKKLLEAIT